MSVPGKLLGTLVAGLGDDSRIGRKILGVTGTTDQLLLAELIDSVNLLIYALSGGEKPKSKWDQFIIDTDKEEKEETKGGFDTGEEFMKRRAELLKGQ